MDNTQTKQVNKRAVPPILWWLVALAALLCGSVALVYYWRVFYSYGLYPFAGLSAGTLTLLLCGIVTAGWGIAYLTSRFCRSLSCKAAIAVFCVGLLFCFANPPMETPDELGHYLRAYSISEGNLTFDYNRAYPQDVNALATVFRGAWTNAHNGSTLKVTQTDKDVYTDGHAIANNYVRYAEMAKTGEGVVAEKEPIIRMILPFVPQAAGMALARLFGGGALACLYAGRMANLAVYALLCWYALRKAKRYLPVFFAFMLLPLSLYLAASVSYEGLLLGLAWVIMSYFCADEIKTRDVAVICACIAVMTSVKILNILFLVLPFLLPKTAWKTRIKKWQAALLCLGAGLGLFWLFTWYGNTFMYNYPEIGRMLGSDVNQAAQLGAIFSNIPRYIMVLLGTLYENNFFVNSLGLFGALDISLPFVSSVSVCLLGLAAALSVHEKSSLPRRSLLGLLLLAVAYIGAVCTGLYITYAPVYMVRIIGLQPRYFLPALFILVMLLAAALSHILKPTLGGGNKALHAGLLLAVAVGVCSAVLLFQHYFVGPVTVLSADTLAQTAATVLQSAA